MSVEEGRGSRDNDRVAELQAVDTGGARSPSLSPQGSLNRAGAGVGAGSGGGRQDSQANDHDGSERPGDPVELVGSDRKRGGGSGSGSGSGSRLVRWAAALAGGHGHEHTHAQAGGLRTPSASPGKARKPPTNSAGGGGGNGGGNGSGGTMSSSGGGSGTGGGEPASTGGVTAGTSLSAEGGLFTSSPLRHRFRTGRRGSTSGWSLSSSSNSSAAAGWNGSGAAAAGDGDRGVGAGPWTFLRKIFKGRLAKHVFRQVKMLIALTALSVAALGALLVGLCLYLTVRPWGRATFRRLLCSQLAAPLVDSASLLLPRTRVRVTGDSDMLDGLSPCVLVSNTLPGNAFLGLDWWAILMVARAVRAHGLTKVLVSERLINTPVFGWILKILEFPGLGDCYQGDRDRVKKSVASFGRDSVSAGPSGVPYMFLHFPEGDTLNRDTLASSLEFAKREDRPELMHLLLPHTTALSACLDGLRAAKPVVYDITLAAAGYTGEVPCPRSPPSDWDILKALVAGRAWEQGGRGDGAGWGAGDTPCMRPSCMRPSCGCRPRPASDAAAPAPAPAVAGVGGDRASGGEGDLCGESSCLCRTGAWGASLGFSSVGGAATGAGGPPAADAMGLGGRSQSVGGVTRTGSGDWGHAGAAAAVAGGVPRGDGRGWGRGCQDIHVRIKRYSLEEVVGNTHWLDDRWAEKERLLSYFSRHQSFPSDGRGFPARRTLDTRGEQQFEGSAMAFVRLSAVLLLVPLLSLVAVPLVVAMAAAALTYRMVCAAVRAVATRVLPRRFTRRIWCRYGGEEEGEEEEDELGQDYTERQSTLTPWWGGPATPLNTPAPGGAATGPLSYIRR